MPLFQQPAMADQAPPDPSQDPNAQASDAGGAPQSPESSGGVDQGQMLNTLADHILYDPRGIQMIQEMVSSHMKDPAMGAALMTCSILFQLKDKMQDVGPDRIIGQNGVATHILDSIFEIFHHMKVKTSQEMFDKALGLVGETYNLTSGTADQAMDDSQAPSPGGLFANPMGAMQQ